MHIRIFHQYFRTPENGGSLRSYFLAREFIRKGFEVSVITATNEKKARSEKYLGIEVHYLPVYYSNHLSFRSRLGAFTRYVWLAIRKNRELHPADLNYVISTPLTTGLIALSERIIRGTPYIFEIGDIWPEAPIQLNILRNPLTRQAARALEKLSYNNAKALIALSPSIKAYLLNQSEKFRVFTITNFCDRESLRCSADRDTIRKRYGFSKEDFIITYAGTIGMANHLEYLVDLAAAIPEELPVRVIIMGDGARKNAIRDYAKKINVKDTRLVFLEHGNRSEVACVLKISQAIYISFHRAEVLHTGCPNKFFDALDAGKLTIINFNDWLAEFIDKHNIGFSYDPSSPGEAVERLNNFIEHPELLEGVAERSRELAPTFTTGSQMKKLIDWVKK